MSLLNLRAELARRPRVSRASNWEDLIPVPNSRSMGLLAKVQGRHTLRFLEGPGKIVLGVVAQLKTDFLDREIRVQQETLGAFVQQLLAKTHGGDAVLFPEETAEPTFAQAGRLKVFADGGLVVEILFNESPRTLHRGVNLG